MTGEGVIGYRYKNPNRATHKKSKPDEVVLKSQLRPGGIVWVNGPNGRDEYICDDCFNLLPAAEYRRRKEEKSRSNEAENLRRAEANRRNPCAVQRSTHAGVYGIYAR
jgi:hypothetical protein